jgi:RNA polymerase sigma-70 factor (ECF subfamily)
VQEVFFKVWEKRKTLTEVERFDSYLFIIARNYIISELRKKIAIPLGDAVVETFEEESKAPDKVLAHKQLTELVAKGMNLLPQQQKIAFALSRDEGLSHEEIAQQMELSKETVKKHICRALNFIRTYVRTNSELIIALMVLFEKSG